MSRSCFLATLCGCAVFAMPAVAGTPTNHGYDDLQARLGPDTPTGAGVPVATVESGDAQGDYAPSVGAGQYTGITFFEQSGPTGQSTHSERVGRRFYGADSITMSIDEVYLYETTHWLLGGFLRGGTASQPVITPGGIKVFSQSWVGLVAPTSANDELCRRADLVMLRDNVLMVVGVNNVGEPNYPLMSHVYNGISVGLAPPEEHQAGNTLSLYDGPGRLKPEIVTVETKTSWATPYVSAGAVLLTETARDMEARGGSTVAERGEVLKAVLLGGAQKTIGWTNNPQTSGPDRGRTTQPIDTVVGVGALDVNRAHLMLTAGEQDGATAVPTTDNIQHVGWDLAPIDPSSSTYYRFELRDQADVINIVATWHRRVATSFNSWSLADVDLILWRVDDLDQLQPLTGDDGVGVYTSGNVVSESSIDNVEHLHIEGLAACEYVLEVRRNDSTSADAWDVAVAWYMPEPISCIANVDRKDDEVNLFDLLALIDAWGSCPEPCPPSCPADITGDNEVDLFDLLDLLDAWGPCE